MEMHEMWSQVELELMSNLLRGICVT